MKFKFIIFLCFLMAGCTFVLDSPSTDTAPIYYEEAAIEQAYCMYDPLPLDFPMRYCDSYSNAECCIWEQEHSDDWICEYEWCFYWGSCEWEYIDSECWW